MLSDCVYIPLMINDVFRYILLLINIVYIYMYLYYIYVHIRVQKPVVS